VTLLMAERKMAEETEREREREREMREICERATERREKIRDEDPIAIDEFA